MRLEELHIREIKWGDNQGQYEGKIKFNGKNGNVEVYLDADKIKKVINVVAETLVETSKDIAENLTAEIIQHSPTMLSKAEE